MMVKETNYNYFCNPHCFYEENISKSEQISEHWKSLVDFIFQFNYHNGFPSYFSVSTLDIIYIIWH